MLVLSPISLGSILAAVSGMSPLLPPLVRERGRTRETSESQALALDVSDICTITHVGFPCHGETRSCCSE